VKANNARAGIVAKERRRGLLTEFWVRLIKEKPLGTVGLVIIVIVGLAAIFADFIAPYGMRDIHLCDRLTPPGANYILGTDTLGRDMLSRVIYGARISMAVGLLGPAVSVTLATLIGLSSGYLGGWFDTIMQRFVDTWMCFPPLFVALTIMSILTPSIWAVIFVLGLTDGIRNSRVIRSAVFSTKENVYVQAARSIGCSTPRIVAKHILPNVAAPLIVIFTLNMGRMILAEATLSFLGYGVPPPEPSWGGILSGVGRDYLLQGPWIALWPGVALALVVFGVNMFGDAVRDLLDPRLRGGVGRYGVRMKKEAAVKNEPSPLQGLR